MHVLFIYLFIVTFILNSLRAGKNTSMLEMRAETHAALHVQRTSTTCFFLPSWNFLKILSAFLELLRVDRRTDALNLISAFWQVSFLTCR